MKISETVEKIWKHLDLLNIIISTEMRRKNTTKWICRTKSSEKNKPSFQKDAKQQVNMKSINLVCVFILFGMWLRRPKQNNAKLEILGRPQKPRNIIISAEIDILGEN